MPDSAMAPHASKDAPQSPPEAPVGSEWLPRHLEGSQGILERLTGYQPADDEWWHEHRRNACRAYLGTKLNWHPAAPAQTVAVDAADLHSDLHKLMLADLRRLWPWTDVLDTLGALAAGQAAERFGATAVRQEWADCMALGSKYDHVDAVAEAVHFCRRRDERAKIVKHMLGVCHAPELVEADCQRLREVG